jgi:uncharacterized membrane protein YeaQ/YmgE (transglycosylase-associated protein family)
MGIIAWIILGLASGLLASRLLPSGRTRGLALNCVLGISGALLGGWAAASLLHAPNPNAFFSFAAWLTALIGAAILLLAYHALSGRSGEPGKNGTAVPAVVPVRRNDAPR